MAAQTRRKIEESINTCLANLPACKTIKKLAVTVDIMIKEVAMIIRPDCDVSFTSIKKDQ